MNSLRVNILIWKIGAIVCALFLAVALVFSMMAGAYIPAVLFAIFLFLAAVLILGYGPVQVSEEEIAMFSPLGTYSIRWESIHRIRYGRSHLIFEGGKARLTVPNPQFWNGKNKRAVIEVVESFCRKSGIIPTRSFLADFQLSKNAKKTA